MLLPDLPPDLRKGGGYVMQEPLSLKALTPLAEKRGSLCNEQVSLAGARSQQPLSSARGLLRRGTDHC